MASQASPARHLTQDFDRYRTPGFNYGGSNPALEISSSLIDNLDTNKPAHELAPLSIPLALYVKIYTVGRDLSWGSKKANCLPEQVKRVGEAVYRDAQKRKGRGFWTRDAFLFEPEVREISGKETPYEDGYVAGRVFQNIEGFVRKGDKWDIIPSDGPEKTVEERLWLPPGHGNFIIPGRHWSYNGFGLPDSTTSNREKAIKAFMNRGLTEERAEKELSVFYRADSGLVAVDLWSGCDGPLCVSLSGMPEGRIPGIGSFAAKLLGKQTPDSLTETPVIA